MYNSLKIQGEKLMDSDQALHIAVVTAGAFALRYLHEAIANYLRARKTRKAQASRQQ